LHDWRGQIRQAGWWSRRDEGLAYEELARRAGYAEGAGAFNNRRGRLHSLGLVTYRERSRMQPADLQLLKQWFFSAKVIIG